MLKALADLMPGAVGEQANADAAYWKGAYTAEEAEKPLFVKDEMDEVRKENKRLRRALATIVSTASSV